MDILDKMSFEVLNVIGQSAEKEFIFCYHITERRIICFDQHAADERIRYEILLDTLGQHPENLDEIKSQACHGAIRFGDSLTLIDCQELIKRLLQCKIPYKCAHSRCGVCVLKNIDRVLYAGRKFQKRS